MKKTLICILLSLFTGIYASGPTHIVGGGIVGALEAYYAYKDAEAKGEKICVTVYEKGSSVQSSTNTAYNIGPSLTIDEILSVVPRGSELIEKLTFCFDQPAGIRVDDVPGVNDSEAAIKFKEAVATYGSDKNHDDRTLSLLMLGKKSMDLWQQLYDEGDEELKAILTASNFNPCHETKSTSKLLHDGYRIDLIYGIPNAQKRALNMKADYEKLGYQNCALLSPDETAAIDPFLSDFCHDHSDLDTDLGRIWKHDSVALWRPGGCIDTRAFLPKLYAYLEKVMGQHNGEPCFQLKFSSEVTGIKFDPNSQDLRIIGLSFSDGTEQLEDQIDAKFIFCPGEAIGTLRNLGFNEPDYAAFAGPSLQVTIPLSQDQVAMYKNFSHCMEVHKEGICLAWQARFKENSIFISGSGTKAFYGDKQPDKDEDFAKNRNLVQLNMFNDVLPEFISLAYATQTRDKTLTAEDLLFLEEKGTARRWVGRRAVAYDGYPTIGALYSNNRKVSNARCTTHLGSGGVSFGPGAVFISRCSEQNPDDAFVQKILTYADSNRAAE